MQERYLHEACVSGPKIEQNPLLHPLLRSWLSDNFFQLEVLFSNNETGFKNFGLFAQPIFTIFSKSC